MQQLRTRDCHIGSYESLCAEWASLSNRYLPISSATSIWRFSRPSLPADPEQGWKLHVSATVLNATRVLRTIAPFLTSRDVLYKAPASLDELSKINSGIFYGYSQVGKCFTIYPQTEKEAVVLARKLHRLTSRMSGPPVPFDEKYRQSSLICYRYGAFKTLEIKDHQGEISYAMRDTNGDLIPDRRDSSEKPDWLLDPFCGNSKHDSSKSAQTPLQTTYKAFLALAQRGRGGVYQAFDFSVSPPRLCALKEGRKNGEVGWDGRDGYWRVRHEGRVLTRLSRAGVNVPQVYSTFKAENNYYLVMELIEGDSLEKYLIEKKRRLRLTTALRYCVRIAVLMDLLHRAGWVWRDCKPRNIIITSTHELRPLDFEGACPIDRPDPLPWGSPSYIAPEWTASFTGQSRLPEDLYALGSVMHLLLAGCPPDIAPLSLERLRKNIPARAGKLVAELLDPDPERRPNARIVVQRLGAILRSMTRSGLRREVNAAGQIVKSRVGTQVVVNGIRG